MNIPSSKMTSNRQFCERIKGKSKRKKNLLKKIPCNKKKKNLNLIVNLCPRGVYLLIGQLTNIGPDPGGREVGEIGGRMLWNGLEAGKENY